MREYSKEILIWSILEIKNNYFDPLLNPLSKFWKSFWSIHLSRKNVGFKKGIIWSTSNMIDSNQLNPLRKFTKALWSRLGSISSFRINLKCYLFYPLGYLYVNINRMNLNGSKWMIQTCLKLFKMYQNNFTLGHV